MNKYLEVEFVKKDYSVPEDYADFDISKVEDINAFAFIDIKTAYLEDKGDGYFSLLSQITVRKKEYQGTYFHHENIRLQGRTICCPENPRVM